VTLVASMSKRIRWAGLLICLGLAIQLVTLLWIHPLAFMTFLIIGCPLTTAGILLCLFSLLNGGDVKRRVTPA